MQTSKFIKKKPTNIIILVLFFYVSTEKHSNMLCYKNAKFKTFSRANKINIFKTHKILSALSIK